MIKRFRILRVGILILLVFNINSLVISTSGIETSNIIDDLTSESNIKFLESNINIRVSETDKYQNGLNLFGLYQGMELGNFAVNNSYLAITNMKGEFVQEPLAINQSSDFSQLSWINDTTILADYQNQPMFYNVVTKVNQTFELAEGQHHDIQYNPVSNTFIVLEYYIDDIINASGDLEEMLVDRISEYDMEGQLRWRWLIKDYLNFTNYYDYLDQYNMTIPYWSFERKAYLDPTHANSLYLDVENQKLVLGVRHFNQFITIDYPTKEIDYIVGMNTKFTSYRSNGSITDSLWYNAHDVKPIGNNEYLMFDNNFKNVTDPGKNETVSSILRIKVNPLENTTEEIFRWAAPKSYWGYFWGGVQLLDNGNYLGAFGSHQNGPINEPFHQSFGGAAIEVDPEGNIVWELRVPFGWGFYRMQRFSPIIDLSETIANLSPVIIDRLLDSPIITLEWKETYSNFPDTYKIELETDEVESGEWVNGDIAYELDTTDFLEGGHFITLTVVDKAGNEKSVTIQVTIIVPPTSTKDDSSVLKYLLTMNVIFILAITRRKFNRLRKNNS